MVLRVALAVVMFTYAGAVARHLWRCEREWRRWDKEFKEKQWRF